ncbi:MAG: hypothetical protein CMP15_08115 [Rickettsiales bacterium]|nr:hypothetical protein [Rickettsiales bacterium]
MIKKIFSIFILLITIIFLAIYIVVDKILIKNIITNIEDKLNLNIYFNEDYSLSVFPKLSLLTKFDLDKKNLNLFIKKAEFDIYKNYDNKPAEYSLNAESLIIEKLIVQDLVADGTLYKYSNDSLNSHIEIYPKGYIKYQLNADEKNSIKFVNLILKRINLPDAYKKLSSFIVSILEEDTSFISKMTLERELLTINYFDLTKNEFSFNLKGTYNLKSNILDIIVNLKNNKENFIEIKITDNINNPNIQILSYDNSINYTFFVNDIENIFVEGIDNILKNLMTNE